MWKKKPVPTDLPLVTRTIAGRASATSSLVVGVLVGDGVAVAVGVKVGVGEGVAVGVEVGVAVAVGVGVKVAVGSGIGAEVGIGSGVGVEVGSIGSTVATTWVGVGVGVDVGVGVGSALQPRMTSKPVNNGVSRNEQYQSLLPIKGTSPDSGFGGFTTSTISCVCLREARSQYPTQEGIACGKACPQ